MKKILICDDEQKIREVIREYASFEGYEVCEAEDGVQAIEAVKKQDFDAIILDIMMPRIDGFTTCKEIKKIKDIPIIMLSARGEEYDKLYGFELGIEDYVVKPFSPKEVMARLKVVMGRSLKKEENVFEISGLKVDFPGRSVYVDNIKVDMTPKEYELLFYFVKNKNIALSREKLLTEIWGYDYFGDDRTVDTHIKMLRGSLGKYRDYIVTVRGMGYKFEV
ncbi:MAG: response regulator transcription factor [Ruminococcaceae bacterium]|nr:response regulator transcription factor [Oscillospiraceae bacterium]